MKRILKYHVFPPTEQGEIAEVELPRGARILSAGAQGEHLVVWALVDHVQANTEQRQLRVIATGDHLTENALDGFDFVGTVQMYIPVVVDLQHKTSELVWHVWAKPSDWSRA